MKMIGKILVPLALVTAAPASAMTLDFAGAICGGGGACLNGSSIDQSYGDVAGQLDVVYDSDNTQAGNQAALYWSTGYETLVDVAYTVRDNSSPLLISFNAMAGWGVRILGFEFANYLNRSNRTVVTLTDLGGGGATLFDTGPVTPETDCAGDVCTYAGSWGSSTGIELSFGPDAWNTGIDNIRYETYRVGAVPIPVPASGLLLMAGLAGFTWLRRKK